MNIERKPETWFKKIGFYLSKGLYKLRSASFAKTLLMFYLFITLVGALLLWMPAAQTGIKSWDPTNTATPIVKGHIGFIDALFTSASAFSDTGLSTTTIAVSYNEWGQAIIAILILIGGIGWFALKVYIFNIIFGRPISFKTREALAAERGSVKVGVTRSLIKVAVTSLLVILFIASFTLTIIFYYTDVSEYQTYSGGSQGQTMYSSDTFLYKNPYHNTLESVKFGIFHAISALNNAGFDIIGNNSLVPYYYNILIQVVFVILFVIGGLGYPVIYDVFRYFRSKKTGEHFRFSLFTKLSCSAYIVVALLGIMVTFLIESNSSSLFWKDADNHYGTNANKSWALFFNTMSTRNAGFSTIYVHDMSRGTLIVYIIMMFIGSAPSSTAGGIRTTTIAIIILGIWSLIRGRKNIYVFGRKIEKDVINRSFIVFTASVIILIIGSLVSLTSFDSFGGKIPTMENYVANNAGVINTNDIPQVYNFTEMVFEVGSAFGTTGLSAGITKMLSLPSKLILILIMFIGQLGISSSILIWGSRKNTDNHYSRLPQEVSIG